MSEHKLSSPSPQAVRHARIEAGRTQTEAAHLVSASLRAWQQWEAGDRAMPPGLFELFMIKTGQWPLAPGRQDLPSPPATPSRAPHRSSS